MGSFTSKKKDTSSKSSYEPQGAKTDADKSFPPPPLQLKANKQDKLGTKETGSSPTESFSASQEVIQQKTKKKSTISAGEARKIIVGQTDKWGTDEAAIYSAIRSCNNRNALKTDDAVQNALVAEMGGHDLWKAYLLMEYGSESNFSSAINALWKATKGMGTDEDGVFQALEKMSARDKKSFKLDYILRCELSGDQLKKARNLIVTQDSIKGNAFGAKGKEDLVIDENSLKKLIDSTFVGGNSEKLKVSMTALQNGASGAAMQKALTTIETVRGLPAGAGLTQYKKTIAKQKAGVAYYVAMKKKKKKKVNLKKDHPSPNLDTSKHGEFMGSNAQLRFGKILGDVFGLDAVFGSLISPSGGMAGPGNERIPFIEDGGAVATHGAVHDAAGYLYNCHGIGPGYDYLQSEVGSDPSNPLAGQTNIKWWIKEYKKRGKSVGRFEKLLNSKAYIGAAFAKRYKVLNLAQKKKALKVICETNTAMLKIAGITNTDRVAKVKQLMKVSNAGEKKQLANYYYNNDTFGSFLAAGKLKRIMKPNVSPSVYKKYVDRIMDKNKSRGLYF